MKSDVDPSYHFFRSSRLRIPKLAQQLDPLACSGSIEISAILGGHLLRSSPLVSFGSKELNRRPPRIEISTQPLRCAVSFEILLVVAGGYSRSSK